MNRSTKKICFIASAGGHFAQITQLKEVEKAYDCFYVVTHTKATEAMRGNRYIVSDLVRLNKSEFFFRFIKMMRQQWAIFMKERPDIIITTGAGVVIPTCIIAKLFRRKIIYIESYARITTPNKTGKLLYKFADTFIIQWEELRHYYPDAIYGGGIY